MLHSSALFHTSQGTTGGGGRSDGEPGPDRAAGNFGGGEDNGGNEGGSNPNGGDNNCGPTSSSQEECKEERREGGAGKEVVENESSQLTITESGNAEVNDTEQMLLRAAMHVKRSNTQREGYQLAEDQCKQDKINNLPHLETTYCFVVDFEQNIECPSFMKNNLA